MDNSSPISTGHVSRNTQTCCMGTHHPQLPGKWQTATGGAEKWNSIEKAKSRDKGRSSSLFAQFDLNYVLTLNSQEWIWGKISYYRALASCIALLQKSCTTSISFNGQLLPTTYTQFFPLIWPSSLKIKLNINIDIHTTVSRQEGEHLMHKITLTFCCTRWKTLQHLQPG